MKLLDQSFILKNAVINSRFNISLQFEKTKSVREVILSKKCCTNMGPISIIIVIEVRERSEKVLLKSAVQ